jgi:hypothetical protein
VQIVSISLISGARGFSATAFSPATVVTVCRVVSAHAKKYGRSASGNGSVRRETTCRSARKSDEAGAPAGRRKRRSRSAPSACVSCTAFGPIVARLMEAVLYSRSTTTRSAVGASGSAA